MTGALSIQTYSACLLADERSRRTRDVRDALRRAGRRLWPGDPDRAAVECSRALLLLPGPEWLTQVGVATHLAREALQLHGSSLPIIVALLPGCPLSTREAAARFDGGTRVIDLRAGSSRRAMTHVTSAWSASG